MSVDSRAAATRATLKVLQDGRSLHQVLADATPLQQELVYGVLRWYWRLRDKAERLLTSPLRRKDSDVMVLILLGLYQLDHLRVPPHAAINETVNACTRLGKPWAKSLVNAILRNAQRAPQLSARNLPDEARYSHPQWLIEKFRDCWPENWESILEGNNARPPMALRVNRARQSRAGFLAKLDESGLAATVDPLSVDGVILQEPAPVTDIPGFEEGHFVVQDTAAQWAAQILPVTSSGRVLDACAAPGGKLTHLLEVNPAAGEIVAIEVERNRANLIEENLKRLEMNATVKVADVANLQAWWDGVPFDRVLIDAPCSGTGVIRRRPDIKHLRRPSDLAKLVGQQAVILERLWQTLRPGGYMLYITCSVLEEENEQQLKRFMSGRSDASSTDVELPVGMIRDFGVQTLPGVHGVDGFYYALVRKSRQ